MIMVVVWVEEHVCLKGNHHHKGKGGLLWISNFQQLFSYFHMHPSLLSNNPSPYAIFQVWTLIYAYTKEGVLSKALH